MAENNKKPVQITIMPEITDMDIVNGAATQQREEPAATLPAQEPVSTYVPTITDVLNGSWREQVEWEAKQNSSGRKK